MRFGYVLLWLVTLTSIHTSHGRCSNDLAGVQTDDICCDDGCGKCGGRGCARLPGGPDSCCTSKIRDRGVYCSNTRGAPCIVRTLCDRGYPGVQKDDICCDATCGTCGGPGCSSRPGGSEGCCSSRIRDSDKLCDDTQEGPCIMNGGTFAPTPAPTPASTGVSSWVPTEAPTEFPAPTPVPTGVSSWVPTEAPTEFPAPTPATPTGVSSWVPTEAPTEFRTPTPTPIPVATCSNGLLGFEDGSICCELQCGTCGGPGCSGRPGGEDGCCSSVINASEVMCSEAMAAPCIIDN